MSAILSTILISISIKGGIIPSNLSVPSKNNARQVTKVPHPEMADVEQGDELLVVNFTPDDEFNRKVTDGFLSQSLKDRIDELDDPWDDDDDGDVPAVVRR